MPTIDATTNPAQAQDVIDSVMDMVNDESAAETADQATPDITPPLDSVVTLPGGHITFAGEAITNAEVRELTGRDEEALSRASTQEALLQEVLQRGVVRIGSEEATEETLNNLLSGDRDYLLLKVFMATFGPTLEVTPFCNTCGDRVNAELDLESGIEIRKLNSPFDRAFSVDITRGTAKATLPTGYTQRLMLAAADRNLAELSTILLSNTVTEIRGMTVIDASQVLDLSIRDRRKITEEILSRSPGPQMQEATCSCPNCESKLEVPLSLANLFRL